MEKSRFIIVLIVVVAVLAYCQWAEGYLTEAKNTAEAFESIKDKVNPSYHKDMMNYF